MYLQDESNIFVFSSVPTVTAHWAGGSLQSSILHQLLGILKFFAKFHFLSNFIQIIEAEVTAIVEIFSELKII